jgi:hypothetical protein
MRVRGSALVGGATRGAVRAPSAAVASGNRPGKGRGLGLALPRLNSRAGDHTPSPWRCQRRVAPRRGARRASVTPALARCGPPQGRAACRQRGSPSVGDARIGQSACPLACARMAPLAGRGPVARCQPIGLAGAPPAKIAERRGMLVAQLQRDLGRVFDVVVRESPERHTRMFVDPPDGTNRRPTPRALRSSAWPPSC